MRLGIIQCLLASSLALGCARGGGDAASALRVELDAYSGRPNPVWSLTEAEGEETLRRLRGVPPVQEILPLGGLGYRGFVLTGSAREGFPGTARVAAGLITFGDPERAAVYRDERQLEPFLMDLARARGYGAALEGR